MIVRSNSVLKLDGGRRVRFFISAPRLCPVNCFRSLRNQKHAVTTATATIGIRGTGFYVEADPN